MKCGIGHRDRNKTKKQINKEIDRKTFFCSSKQRFVREQEQRDGHGITASHWGSFH